MGLSYAVPNSSFHREVPNLKVPFGAVRGPLSAVNVCDENTSPGVASVIGELNATKFSKLKLLQTFTDEGPDKGPLTCP